MTNAAMGSLRHIPLIFIILCCFTARCYSDGILGCGGFVRSSVDIEYSKVQVKLYTKQGSLKYQTDCAPNNGYYFMPIYDKGDYIIKLAPPDGWSFEPSEVALSVDGETDMCSQGQDVDFTFQGFGVTGQVVSLGSTEGPAGVTVTLTSTSDRDRLKTQVTTGPAGRFTFSPVPAGDYEVTASHPVWKLARHRTQVSVRGDNGDVGTQLAVAGFDVSGMVVSGSEPVSDVTFVLHGRRTEAAPLTGCDVTPAAGYTARSGLPPALCRVVSDAQGRFVFPVVPSGEYVVVPFYAGARTRFDVRPTEVEVRVAQDSAAIGEPFQVAGYTISGRVLTSVAGGKKVGLGGATVRLDARSVVTEKDGSYTIEGANSGQFRLSAEADSVQFESRTVTVSPSAPQLPDLVAAAFQVCGKVDLSNLPDGVSAGPRSVEFKVAGSETAYTAVTGADGAFCTFLRPATYRLRVVVSEDERKRGLSFGSAQQELAVSAPVSGVTFSPFRARVSGTVRCLESCAGLQLTLSAEGLPPRAATAAADGRFAFDGVLPGQYEVTVTKDEWCWAASSVPVTVSAADVTGLQLIQSGYRLTLVTSHSTEILFRLASAGSTAPAADYATLTAGSNTLCVPAAGVYQVEPRGCHQFQEPALRADTTSTTPLELRAVTHRVSGSVSCREPTKDVRVRLTVETEVTELETRAEDGGKVHRFSVQARPGQVMTFQPQSDTMLFTPTYRQLTAGEDCAEEAVTFQARKGTFISGRISPSLAGARITVSAADMEPVTAITDDKGFYQIGPLVPDRQYEVDAEKEGYVLTKTDGKAGHFEARKLAELRLRVTDEAGRPLPGVLLSVSGGKDYRRNSLTDEDGRQVFLSLSPGQYFIRPMMKEYEFTPASKMAEIAEGATLEVTVSGRRVAYSLVGRVTTLTGDPEPGVVVEAVAGPQCDHHQEEATSEPTGALRIRGLRPQCEYTVRMKTGTDTNTQFSRGIPDSQTVRVADGDVSGFRLVAFRRLGEMDVTVRVVSAPQHLSSLRLVVSAAGSEAPLISQPVAGSPLVVLPAPLARDGRQYVARLESSLSAATHTVRSAEVAFTADAAARHIELQFSAERRPVDAELGAGPVLGLPLTLLAVLLAVNQRKCLEMGKKLWAKYQARAGAGAARRESGGAAAGDGIGVIVRPVTVKVKARKV
ncbi:nodal modulator 1-like [Amphibalanus amphitrite]|uniref:nodal modulator 1-like n=1 Tax=Amphibalanus amphitrite TaxID=1232801 RepID=UPI001C91725E|nr:nodal modulator 1-like [Amphibalanus amphitrite]